MDAGEFGDNQKAIVMPKLEKESEDYAEGEGPKKIFIADIMDQSDPDKLRAIFNDCDREIRENIDSISYKKRAVLEARMAAALSKLSELGHDLGEDF